MQTNVYYLVTLYVLYFSTYEGLALFIEGCPMFGCRPSGSFSFYLQVPRKNVSIRWTSNIFDPVPTKLGCVANSYSLVCPNNGPFSEDKGYRSIFLSNGSTRWRESELNFPTLPLLDNYGDITGSDGVNLVHLDADGTTYPVIPCDDLRPMFNMALVGNSYLLLVSESGSIVVRETNGVPVGSLTLNATIENKNGSFIPIAQPVINVQRFYVLTKFVPLPENMLSREYIRLYAFDVSSSITNRIVVAWHMNLPGALSVHDQNPKSFTHREKGNRRNSDKLHSIASNGTQALLWNRYNNTVYVITQSQSDVDRKVLTGIRDIGASSKIVFQAHIDVLNMAMFVSDHCEDVFCVSEIEPILWVSTNLNLIHQVSLQGKIIRTINISEIFDTTVSITTKLTVVRNSDFDNDVLLLGITRDNVLKDSRQDETQAYAIAIDTAAKAMKSPILWSIPIPDKLSARGQVSGTIGLDSVDADQIIIYADDTRVSARVFSISSKR